MSINPPHPDTSHGEYITTPGFLGLPISFPTRNTISLRKSASCCQSFRIWNSYITYLLSREKGHELCFCYGISSTIIRGATLNDRNLCRCEERTRRDSYQNILRKTQHSLYYVVKEGHAHEQPCSQALSSLSPLTLGEKPWLRQVT